MTYRERAVLTAVVAFAGGYLFGILSAPRSGRQARSLIAQKAQEQSQRFEAQLHAVEEHLLTMERHLESTLQAATGRAVDHYLPNMEGAEEDWDLSKRDVLRDLRRIPRT